jgi:N-acetylglucosaminyldiphosphoundecaprenol N-acetyl-beta-D-mannosaminyltransferase
MTAATSDRSNIDGPRSCQMLGFRFDAVTMAQAVQRCAVALKDESYLQVGVINAAKVVTMRRDRELRRAVTECGMILADGQAVVWASKVLRTPLPERVAGIDLFTELLAEAARLGYGVYFLGARPEILDRMLAEVGSRFPELRIAGARNGYFGPAEEADVAAGIRASGASLLFLGMPSPKKELFLSRHGASTGAIVVHGVGGSFDVLAGLTKRAPLWYQRHGLEWFYRARQEPLRLGRRYLKTNFAFMLLVAREVLATRLRGRSGQPRTRPDQRGSVGNQPPGVST